MMKVKAKEIYCDIYNGDKKISSGPLAYFREFSFEKLLTWVWRTCPGCIKLEVYPDRSVDAIYENKRVEKYTLREKEISSSNVCK